MISFISLQQAEFNSGWNIVQKSFPTLISKSIILSIKTKIIGGHEDRKIAEVAAKQMAELAKISFVSENKSVITVSPLCEYFIPVELTSNGRVIGQGKASSLQEAISEAQEYARTKNLLYINPN